MKYQCKICKDIIESSSKPWDMRWCSCGKTGVDNHSPPDTAHRVLGAYRKMTHSCRDERSQRKDEK